jgi:hypothetical protein
MEAAWASHPTLCPTGIPDSRPTVGTELTNHLGIKLSMSVFHPQADDQQRRLGRTTSARRARHRRFRDDQDVLILRELRLPTRSAVDPTSSVGGEFHQGHERVAASTFEKLAALAPRISEIAIKDSWEPELGWSIGDSQTVLRTAGSAGCERLRLLRALGVRHRRL